MAESILRFSDARAHSAAISGGKGASLSRLAAGGFPVPPGFVITADAFEVFLDSCGGAETIATVTGGLDVEDGTALERASDTIRGMIASAPMPEALTHAIRHAHQQLAQNDLVAVRSSAASEDSSAASFAGQQETYLNTGGADAVLMRVRDCWASFFSPRALFYRGQKGVLSDARMAVVVQEMVQADKSGVMFTVDPIRNRRECLIVEGAPGLGEAIVSGEITPDHYVLSRDDGAIVEEFIPDDERGRVLEPAELNDLRTLGLRLEAFFGSPQDVEWCIRGGELLLLQSRPITTLPVHG